MPPALESGVSSNIEIFSQAWIGIGQGDAGRFTGHNPRHYWAQFNPEKRLQQQSKGIVQDWGAKIAKYRFFASPSASYSYSTSGLTAEVSPEKKNELILEVEGLLRSQPHDHKH